MTKWTLPNRLSTDEYSITYVHCILQSFVIYLVFCIDLVLCFKLDLFLTQ